MYTRLLKAPQSSALLFGPRGTGKSTWIRQALPNRLTYDLLSTAESQRLNRDPEAFYCEALTQPPERWIVVDEVQKGTGVARSGASADRDARHVIFGLRFE